MDYYSNYATDPKNRGAIFPVNKAYKKALDVVRERVPKDRTFMLDSIEFQPKKTFFATQAQDEEIFILLRRHWATNLGWITRSILYAFIPPTIFWVLSILPFNAELDFIEPATIVIILLVYYSFLFTRVFTNFIDWYFDIYVVTSERVVSYTFRPFFSYSILETSLENIQDIRQTSAGPIANIFNYGGVKITTASTAGVIDFEKIPKPTIVRNILFDLTKIFRKTHKHGI